MKLFSIFEISNLLSCTLEKVEIDFSRHSRLFKLVAFRFTFIFILSFIFSFYIIGLDGSTLISIDFKTNPKVLSLHHRIDILINREYLFPPPCYLCKTSLTALINERPSSLSFPCFHDKSTTTTTRKIVRFARILFVNWRNDYKIIIKSMLFDISHSFFEILIRNFGRATSI